MTTRILFICLGNICRSPMAEGAFRAAAGESGLGDTLVADSAGIGSWHVGNPPDARAIASAGRRGIDISGQRARQIEAEDFTTHDLIVAMDGANIERLRALAPADATVEIARFMAYAGRPEADVPDPYYGDSADFEFALDLIEEASRGLAAHIASATSPKSEKSS